MWVHSLSTVTVAARTHLPNCHWLAQCGDESIRWCDILFGTRAVFNEQKLSARPPSLGGKRLPRTTWHMPQLPLATPSHFPCLYSITVRFPQPVPTVSLFLASCLCLFSLSLFSSMFSEGRQEAHVQATDAPVCFPPPQCLFWSHTGDIYCVLALAAATTYSYSYRCNLQLKKKKKKMVLFLGGGGLATEMQKITNSEDNSCGQQVAGTSMLSRLIKRMSWKDTGDWLTFLGTPQAWSLSYCAKPICTRQ